MLTYTWMPKTELFWPFEARPRGFEEGKRGGRGEVRASEQANQRGPRAGSLIRCVLPSEPDGTLANAYIIALMMWLQKVTCACVCVCVCVCVCAHSPSDHVDSVR